MEERHSMDEGNSIEENFKKVARRQYLHFFRFWFIAIGILALACVIMKIAQKDVPRANHEAPAERVYDYADVLTEFGGSGFAGIHSADGKEASY